MNNWQEHGEAGHVNVLVRDHDSVITGYGQHDRVMAFLPDASGCYVRIDHKWNLGMPTPKQILKVMREDQGIRGKWREDRREAWPDGSSTDIYFIKD